MSGMLLANIADETTDEEIVAFLIKYGFPPCRVVERFEGDGSQPSVMLQFDGADRFELEKLQPRVHNMFWKHRKLAARLVNDRFR